MVRLKFFPVLALVGIALSIAGCSCPSCPPVATLPGKDFATPENAFEYLREAVIRGEKDESYAHHEFRCLAEKLRADQHIQLSDYFFVRDDVRQFLRDRLGTFEDIRIDKVTLNGPNTAFLDLRSGSHHARATLLRETVYSIFFRDRGTPEVYGTLKNPADGLKVGGNQLLLTLALEDAARDNPGLKPDDVYRVEFESSWKFFGIEGSDFKREVERLIREKEKDRGQKPTAAPTGTAAPPKS